MDRIVIGLIREGKIPPDKRVPLTPNQCAKLKKLYPNVNVVAQTSDVRAYTDQQYLDAGIEVKESLEDCDIILGVKEVNVQDLIPGKTFMFFSHTIKKQPYNRDLLRSIIEKKIRLIDYEALKDKSGSRVIGFGRYAGIVGCYNGFRTLGLKKGLYELKPANQCKDRKEMESELAKVDLPADTKIVLTGYGRVGHGAREILNLLPITEVSPEEYLKGTFNAPVYTQLEVDDYFMRKDGGEFIKQEFYQTPSLYKCNFKDYLPQSDMYIACHYWNSKADNIITQEDLSSSNNRLAVVADISCDIAGPIASTIRPSKISDPIYGYDPQTGLECDYIKEGAIAVMAVDNLPCELPLDASEDFGNELIKEVIPHLIKEDMDKIIANGTETDFNGHLTEQFSYLKAYLAGTE